MAQNYILLERIELNASAASVEFTNIPQSGYTDLKVEISARNTATINGWSDLFLSVNGQGAATNVSIRHLYGTGSATGSNTGGAGTSVGNVNPGGNTANTFSSVCLYFSNYTSSNVKSFSSDAVTEQNATNALASLSAGLWNQTAPITSLTFTTDSGTLFVPYSTFSLYGLAAVGTEPVIAPKASGGNITTDGTYWYHTFLSTGAFVPATNLTCNYLVVAGGGGGGNADASTAGGGGGGAGGFRTASAQSLTAQSYTVTIGAGGASATSGTTSSFNSTLTTGGGAGGSNGGSGTAGGSGGGGSRASASTTGGAGNAGSYSPVEGYKGGDANANSAGAGGGGSGAVGVNLTVAGTGTNGGAGSSSSITGTTYAGGGGGGSYTGYPVSSGQAGGGNGGSGSANGVAAITNTGSGGGGAGGQTAGGYVGGSGGSGVVIIRYAMA